MEQWKDIQGYEGTYKISSNGRVMSLKRSKVKEDKIIDSNTSSTGYEIIKLTQNGKCKTYKIHKLVAIAFLNHTPCGYDLVVDHIDGNKSNNELSNLQLISQRENSSKAARNNEANLRGVFVNKKTNLIFSTIKIMGKTVHLGTFKCKTVAHLYYCKAVKFISEFINPVQFRLLLKIN